MIQSYQRLLRQYLYFCASKASKLSTSGFTVAEGVPSEAAPSSPEHMSAYVSIRQHTSADVSIRHLSLQHCGYTLHPFRSRVSRQHTSAYVSIRQHTSPEPAAVWIHAASFSIPRIASR
jgi:hypothetical protein